MLASLELLNGARLGSDSCTPPRERARRPQKKNTTQNEQTSKRPKEEVGRALEICGRRVEREMMKKNFNIPRFVGNCLEASLSAWSFAPHREQDNPARSSTLDNLKSAEAASHNTLLSPATTTNCVRILEIMMRGVGKVCKHMKDWSTHRVQASGEAMANAAQLKLRKKCVNYWKSVGTREKSSLMNFDHENMNCQPENSNTTSSETRWRNSEHRIDRFYVFNLALCSSKIKFHCSFFHLATRQALKNYISLVRSCLFGLFYGVPLFFTGYMCYLFYFLGDFKFLSLSSSCCCRSSRAYRWHTLLFSSACSLSRYCFQFSHLSSEAVYLFKWSTGWGPSSSSSSAAAPHPQDYPV